MTQDGIEAMRGTAKAFEKTIQNMRQQAAEETVKYKSKGPKRMYKVGDQVFYLPSSEKEAKDMWRKPKHMHAAIQGTRHNHEAFVSNRVSARI